jgi:hypothetical protein
MEGFQSGKALLVVVFDCSVESCVAGELAYKAEGLAPVVVRLSVMIANPRCSAMNKLARRYKDSGWVFVLFLSQIYLP